MDIDNLKALLAKFAEDRDWDQFHSPKNLSMALSVEAAELLEHFQWLSEAESKELASEKSKEVSEEIADIQIYLIRLADKLNIDIDDAVRTKLKINSAKYPAEKVRGSSKKYSDYLEVGKK